MLDILFKEVWELVEDVDVVGKWMLMVGRGAQGGRSRSI